MPIAEFPAIPEFAVKIASEWECAILVHSVSELLAPPHHPFWDPSSVCGIVWLVVRFGNRMKTRRVLEKEVQKQQRCSKGII